MKKIFWQKNIYGYLFVAPFVVVFLLFSLYPILNTFYLSFTNVKLMAGLTGDFVGFKNYIALVKTDVFWMSIRNTWMIWILNFIPQIGIAFLVSIMFTDVRLRLKGTGVFKAVFYLPNLLMPAVIASLFFSFFQLYGPVNQFLVRGNFVAGAVEFFRSPAWTRSIVIFIQWWMWFGQTSIILMAGMTAISPSYYESAVIDGASKSKMFTGITLPLLKPILVYTFVTSLVGGLQLFDIPFLITDGRGSPENSVLTMNLLMNLKRTSSQGDIAGAATISVMIFLMSSLVAIMIFQLMGDKEAHSDKKFV